MIDRPAPAPSLSVLVIQPDEDDPLDLFEPWLRDEGLTVRCIRPYAGDPVPARVDEAALMVLGGDMGVHDRQAHPWLIDIERLLSQAVADGTPTLGICLGGQLLASSEGGTVDRGPHGMEVGTPMLRPRPEVEDDELLGAVLWPARFASMHRDAILALPPNAIWLVESERYKHQAFRIGDRAWGVQFHPEVSLERFTSWADHEEDDPDTISRIEAGVRQLAVASSEVVAAAEPMARRFARIVRASQTQLTGKS